MRTVPSLRASSPTGCDTEDRPRFEQVAVGNETAGLSSIDDSALSLIQEGLRGVVRLPQARLTHWIRALSRSLLWERQELPMISGMRCFVLHYGPEGITIAVRIGLMTTFPLEKETGGRVALPVFKEIMLKVYREKLTGPVPKFPARMEKRSTLT